MQRDKVSHGVLVGAIVITAICSVSVITVSDAVSIVAKYLEFDYRHHPVAYQYRDFINIALFVALAFLYGLVHTLLARIFAGIENILFHWLDHIFPEMEYRPVNWTTGQAMIFGALWPLTGIIVVPLTFIACVFASLFKATFPG